MTRDDPFERLRAADPARGRHPNLQRIRAKVTEDAGPDLNQDQAVAEHRTRQPIRRSLTRGIAAAAAAAVGVGAVGYLLGTTQQDTPDPTATVRQHDAIEGSDTAAALQELAEDAPGVLSEQGMGPAADSDRYSDESWGSDGGLSWLRIPVPGPGLSTQTPGPAEVTVQVSELDLVQTVEDWVAAFGLSGGTLTHEGQTVEYVTDEVSVGIAGGSHLYYYDSSLDDCQTVEVDADGESLVEECTTASTPAISETEARAIALSFVESAGLDPADYAQMSFDTLEASVVEVSGELDTGDPQREVNYYSMVIQSDRVVMASVPLPVTTQSLGEYPLISPAAAAERLADPTFGSAIIDLPDSPGDPGPLQQEIPAPEVSTEPGSRIPAGTTEVEVNEAELLTGSYWAPDGFVYQVPVYQFTDEYGTSHLALALEDDVLALSP